MKDGIFRVVGCGDGMTQLVYKPRGRQFVMHVPDAQLSGLVSALSCAQGSESCSIFVPLDGDTSGKSDYRKTKRRAP